MSDSHVMLDLETLGTRPGSSIISIGAVVFDVEGGVSDRRFSAIVDSTSCRDAGLVEDPATIAWWRSPDRPEKAFQAFCVATSGKAEPIARAFYTFAAWLPADLPIKGIWSLGADFDLPILSEAYRRCGFGDKPWPYNAGRCFRTLRALRPDVIASPRTGVVRDALDDAIAQAEHAVLILRAIEADRSKASA